MKTKMNIYFQRIANCKSLLICVLFALAGCTDGFVGYNTNPNEATDEMTKWDNAKTGSFFLVMQQNVLVVAQTGIGTDRYQTVEVMGGDGFAGYFGFPSPSINSAGRYNWNRTSWYGDMFTTNYAKTMNAWRELRNTINDDSDPRFAIASILKVAAMHRVTDTYGPIPYIKFGYSAEVPYDSQKDVYYKFFEELDEAVSILDRYAAAGEKVFSSWDVVYNGDTKQWIKFANTLRLRLAMHIVYADESKAQTEVLNAVANPYGFMSVKNDLAELQHISPIANYESPLYIIKSWDDIAMGATLDSYMNGYEDPRRAAYFVSGSDGVYRGIRAGMSNNTIKTNYTTGLFSTPNVSSNSNVVWMRGSETYFLLAEAALRGWSVGGTAKEFYEAGVKLSFEEHGVSGIDSYLSNTDKVPANYSDPVTTGNSITARGTVTIGWNEGASFDEKLERIITQKYIALYPVGQEAWTEFRRTGYPKVFPVVVNESNGGSVNTETQIRRLPYPVSEYDTNNAALTEGIKLLGGVDNPGVKLWWDKK